MSAAATPEQLVRQADDLLCLAQIASDLADRADDTGDMGDVNRVAVLLRAIKVQAHSLAAAIPDPTDKEA